MSSASFSNPQAELEATQTTYEFLRPNNVRREVIDEIEDFLDTQDSSLPFQFPQWAQAESRRYVEHYRFLIGRSNNRIVLFASCGILYPMSRLIPYFRGLVVTRGPVATDAVLRDALANLIELANKYGFSFMEVSPGLLAGLHPDLMIAFEKGGWRPCEDLRISFRLKLEPTEDQLLASFRKTTRYEVRRAERNGINVFRSSYTEAEVTAFLKIYYVLAERKEFRADPGTLLRNVLAWLATDSSRGTLLLAEKDGVVVAGAVIIRSGKRCWYVWGATERVGEASAGHLIQWNAIRWAKEHGCTEYDFGGYTENATSGPALFKKGFGGYVVSFISAQRKIVNEKQFRLLKSLCALRGVNLG